MQSRRCASIHAVQGWNASTFRINYRPNGYFRFSPSTILEFNQIEINQKCLRRRKAVQTERKSVRVEQTSKDRVKKAEQQKFSRRADLGLVLWELGPRRLEVDSSVLRKRQQIGSGQRVWGNSVKFWECWVETGAKKVIQSVFWLVPQNNFCELGFQRWFSQVH